MNKKFKNPFMPKQHLHLNNDEQENLVQIPFRCSSETESRIQRARGSQMSKTGQKITGNAFILMLLEEGLKKFEG